MPFLKSKGSRFAPSWKTAEHLTHRNGYRAAVFGKSIKEKYTGWFKDNMKHGKGYQVYEDGTFYEGDWADDKRNGNGYLSFVCESTKKTLRIYTGQWKDDYPSGIGMKSFTDGGLYNGEFKLGLRHGWGCMYYANGAIYTGQWSKDKRHGVGRFINHENGNYYEGSFKWDKKCGLGRYFHLRTGQMQEGVWYDFPEITMMIDDVKNRDNAPSRAEFPIPVLTVIEHPYQVYLKRAHEVLALVNKSPQQ